MALAKARAMTAAVREPGVVPSMFNAQGAGGCGSYAWPKLISIGDGRGEWHAAKALARCGVCHYVFSSSELERILF